MPGQLVRPAYQPNPPKQPSIETDWLAFSIDNDEPDANPYLKPGVDKATMQRQIQTEIRVSAYGPNGLTILNHLQDGFCIAQNREQLYLAGMGYVGTTESRRVPELVNQRWYERRDMVVTIRREPRREYPILSFVDAQGTIHITESFSIDWKT